MLTEDDVVRRLEGLSHPETGDPDAVERFRGSLQNLRVDLFEQARLDRLAALVDVDRVTGLAEGRSGAYFGKVTSPDVEAATDSSRTGVTRPSRNRRHSGVVRRFLLWSAGTNASALSLAPSEEVNLAGLGGAVVATAVVATLAAAVTVDIALGSLLWTVVVGAAWGLMVFNLDRWLVATAGGANAWARFLNFLPRLTVAVVFAFLISEPLLLGVFRPEIAVAEDQIRAIDTAHATAQVDAQYEPQLSRIDQQVQGLTHRLNRQRGLVENLSQKVTKEAIGVGKHHPLVGEGPVYENDLRILHMESHRLRDLKATTDKQIGSFDAQRRAIQAAQRASQSASIAATEPRGGLLLRIAALDRLSQQRSGVAGSVWACRLLLILIDSMPILVRLLQAASGRRSYDRALTAVHYQDELRARRISERAEFELELARLESEGQIRAVRELVELDLGLTRTAVAHRTRLDVADATDDT
jgi:hypothetical protein